MQAKEIKNKDSLSGVCLIGSKKSIEEKQDRAN